MRFSELVARPPVEISSELSLKEVAGFFQKTQLPCLLVSGPEGFHLLRRSVLEQALRFGLECELKDLLEKIPWVSAEEEATPARLRTLLSHPLGQALVLKGEQALGLLDPETLLFWGQALSPLPEGKFKFPALMRVIFEKVALVARKLEVRLYLVGGAVRDLLLGKDIFDLDLVVSEKEELLARELARALPAKLLKRSPFGTFKILFKDYEIDLARSRWEYYEEPAALPQTFPAPFLWDLRRRDFTINAIALSLVSPFSGRLLDPLGGCRDLEQRLLRVHHPLSFVDDPTRIFRAARYLVRLGLTPTPETQKALSLALKTRVLDRLSPARLKNEWLRILEEENPMGALKRLGQWGVLKELFPQGKLDEVENLFRLPVSDKEALLEALGLLLSGCDPDLLERGGFSARASQIIKALEALLKEKSEFASWSWSQKVFFLERFPLSVVLAAAALEGDLFPWVKRFLELSPSFKPFLSGKDLKKAGLSPGPVFGEMLNKLRAAQLDGAVKTEEEAWAFLKREFPDVFSS